MENKKDFLAAAVAELVALDEQHEKFVDYIKSRKEETIAGGFLRADGRNIFAEVFGTTFQVVRRSISIDGHFAISEYAFLAEHDREEVCVLTLFLSSVGAQFREPQLSVRICDFNNEYLQTIVVFELAKALMASALFSPRKIQ